jgi:peptidyl-prolyl cis-trans isomerase SurA
MGLDTVMAVVNNDPITLDELRRHSSVLLAAYRPRFSPRDWPTAKERILRAQLENLIDRKLILMEARELGAGIQKSRVQEFIAALPELRTSFNGDLAKYLVAKGITYKQLYKDIEELLLFRGMIHEKVSPKVRVSPAEVRRYYEKNIDKFTEEAAIHCYAISFLKGGNPETGAAVVTKAREALRKINEGAYFPDVANDPVRAEKGGDWGWITPGDLKKKVSDAAFALKEGEYSGIVEGDAAYWILWVKEKRDSSVIPFSAAWKEIELAIKAAREDEEIRRWGLRLRRKASITYPVSISEIVGR